MRRSEVSLEKAWDWDTPAKMAGFLWKFMESADHEFRKHTAKELRQLVKQGKGKKKDVH